MLKSILHVLKNFALPMNSDRRLILGLIKQLIFTPTSAVSRVNITNLKNFLRYRKKAFSCPICGSETTPLYDFPNITLRREHKIGVLRETLQCRKCLASMRQRSLALALLDQWHQRTSIRHESISALAASGLGGIRLFDTDNFSAISSLLRNDPNYIRCSYLPDMPWGLEIEPNYYNINLERIDFPDASFDIMLTSDVMEHVRNCDSAHAEIQRVLSPGGAYIFNVPYEEDSDDDIQLIDTSSNEDVYLCKPQYHGDPLTGGILAYRVFGRNLISKLSNIGFSVKFNRINDPISMVVDGDVFVASNKLD